MCLEFKYQLIIMQNSFTREEKIKILEYDLKKRYASWQQFFKSSWACEKLFLIREIDHCKNNLIQIKEKMLEENKQISFNESFWFLITIEEMIEYTKILNAERVLNEIKKNSGTDLKQKNISSSKDVRFETWMKNTGSSFTNEESFYQNEVAIIKSFAVANIKMKPAYYTLELLSVLENEYINLKMLRIHSESHQASTKALTLALKSSFEKESKKNKPTMQAYALMHYYIEIPINKANGEILAKEYGYKSGEHLINSYNNFTDSSNRLNFSTGAKKSAHEHIKRFRDILPLLKLKKKEAYLKANNEYLTLLKKYESQFP